MIEQHKHTLRKYYQQLRQNMPDETKKTTSASICARIETLKQYQQASRIALYSSIQGEVDLTTLWGAAVAMGKTCYFPKMHRNQTLSFLPATPKTAFIKNNVGILEPDIEDTQAVSALELDMLILPLVAFDAHGTRLGMGGGYYDRTLMTHTCFLLGVGYELQHHAQIISEPWDVALDAIMTEQTLYWSKP